MSQRYLGGIITANPTTPTMTSESGVWTLEQQFQYNTTWSPKIVGNSLRFRSSASAYLSRTPASASNRTTWTWSGWIKRGGLGATGYCLFGAGPASNTDFFYFGFEYSGSADQIVLIDYPGSSSLDLRTTQVFRDPSAWYHVVLAVDTTQATSSNRVKLYVNGVQVTAFGTATYPSQNAQTRVNSTNTHYVGAARFAVSPSSPFDGYMAEINFVDGQALTPSSFGAYDTTGTWQPLPYTGTYGTNGFYLTFADNSAATAAALGKDYSGNGNNWTPNNISLTAGTTYDWMLDSPTNWTSGTGNGVSNYAVLNPLLGYSNKINPQDGNLLFYVVAGSNAYFGSRSTLGLSSGKWYWEVTAGAKDSAAGEWMGVGVVADTVNWPSGNGLGANSGGYEYLNDGYKWGNGSSSTYGASWTTNDVIGVALDVDAQTLTFYKNGVSQGTAFTSMGSNTTWFPTVEIYRSNGTSQGLFANFGQRPFSYTPPTGYKALNTQNLPDPTILNGAQYMAATLWTGTGSAQTILNSTNTATGVSFKPDFVWGKIRSSADYHVLANSIVGPNVFLKSNTTDAETTNAQTITALNSNGFSVGTSTDLNRSGYTFVGWQWQAGQGTTSSNTNGSITSTVSVNATAGFSVVTYTTASANATVGHGLGIAPNLIIVKCRNTTVGWTTYHVSLGNTQYVQLNTTAAAATDATAWNNTSPTSSVFSLGTAWGSNNYVAYCWAAVAGYSAFGSYTGNGSADGPFVYLGFRPRYLLIKSSDTASTNWEIIDTSRNTYNVANNQFSGANSSNAEYTGYTFGDILSNGFKIRDNSSGLQGNYNTNGATYIYAAFAENPFKISRAR